MTTKRLCDACGGELKSYPRVFVEVRMKWSDKAILDLHVTEQCMLKLADLVAELQRGGEI